MSTIYHTNCGCIRSAPEPDWASFRCSDCPDACSSEQHEAEFSAAQNAWHDAWQAECAAHAAATGHRA